MFFEEKIVQYMNRYAMALPGQKICVGLSGGADSVALLLVLKNVGYDLTAVHVNHNLRGEESDGDELFVRRLCENQGIPLAVYSFPAAGIAESRKMGLEEAGRRLRQQAFSAAMTRFGADRIALAHHANDQAETVLFRAARGSSVSGLSGIRPAADILVDTEFYVPDEEKTGRSVFTDSAASSAGQNSSDSLTSGRQGGAVIRVIHPLLAVSKNEIEEWLAGQGISWRTDRTNADENYARNGIRGSVIPYLTEHINRKTVQHITEAAEDLALADGFLKDEAEKRSARVAVFGESYAVLRGDLQREPRILQQYILMYTMNRLLKTRKDLGREQIRQLLQLFAMQTGSRFSLPYDMEAVRTYDGVEIRRREDCRREIHGQTGAEKESAPERAGAGRERLDFPEKDRAAHSGRERPDFPEKDRAAHSVQDREGSEIPVTGNEILYLGGWRFTCRIKPFSGEEIPQNRYTKWFDYAKIRNSLVLRRRRPGDRIQTVAEAPDRPGGSCSLKSYFINAKVPADQRGKIPLFASGNEVYWAVGYRISEKAKITRETQEILEIQAELDERQEDA